MRFLSFWALPRINSKISDEKKGVFIMKRIKWVFKFIHYNVLKKIYFKPFFPKDCISHFVFSSNLDTHTLKLLVNNEFPFVIKYCQPTNRVIKYLYFYTVSRMANLLSTPRTVWKSLRSASRMLTFFRWLMWIYI